MQYAVGALYSHIFVDAKNRLKTLLKPNIIFADGLRPNELSQTALACDNVNYFIEDDLSK